MEYRKFGNTGAMLSVLGMGCMRFPQFERDGKWYVDEESTLPLIKRAYELGINYFDTAVFYLHNNSEETVGKGIKAFRDKIYLSTKCPMDQCENTSDYRRLLEQSLRRLDTDYIDFYHFHGINKIQWENQILKEGYIEEALKAKSEGLIRHISFSFHDEPEVMRQIIDYGVMESVLCQYNLIDRRNEGMIEYAASKGLGVVVMGPVGGGNIALGKTEFLNKFNTDAKSAPELAFRFVLGNKNVTCALSGMSDMAQLEENAQTVVKACRQSEEEWKKIVNRSDEIIKLSELYCTGCDYCDVCPQGIKPSAIFDMYNRYKVWGLEQFALKQYNKLSKGKKIGEHPEKCIECGACEEKCPQKIKIISWLKKAMYEMDELALK